MGTNFFQGLLAVPLQLKLFYESMILLLVKNASVQKKTTVF